MSARWIFEPHNGYGHNAPDGEPWPLGYISLHTSVPVPYFAVSPVLGEDHERHILHFVESANAANEPAVKQQTSFLADLEALWHRTAGLISYHHADDSAKEWGQAKALFPLLLELERQIKSYGGKRPTGQYLISNRERIEWPAETTKAIDQSVDQSVASLKQLFNEAGASADDYAQLDALCQQQRDEIASERKT